MIYINDSLKQYFITGIDNSAVKEVSLFYKTPGGFSSVIQDNIEVEDAETGKYYFIFPVDFLDEVGRWTFWSFVIDLDDNEFTGTPFQLDVLDKGTGQYTVTKDSIKSFLGITDETQDNKISALLPLLIEQYKNIRNAPFDVDKYGTILFPPGFEATIAMMYDYLTNSGSKDISSESIGSYSVSYKDKGDFGYPSSIISTIKRYIRGL